jgi:hypothetical protein
MYFNGSLKRLNEMQKWGIQAATKVFVGSLSKQQLKAFTADESGCAQKKN